MQPSEIAARFIAFTSYTKSHQTGSKAVQTDAKRFSKENWTTFLPLANEGLGRLLLQIAKPGISR